MYEIALSALIFIILVAASLGSLLTCQMLPSAHRQDDTHVVITFVLATL